MVFTQPLTNFLLSLPWPNITNHFTTAICDYLSSAKLFVPGRPYQPRLMVMGKARSLPQSGVHERSGRLWPYSRTLD